MRQQPIDELFRLLRGAHPAQRRHHLRITVHPIEVGKIVHLWTQQEHAGRAELYEAVHASLEGAIQKSLLTTTPSFRPASHLTTFTLPPSRKNRMEPSQKPKNAPPVWRLLNAWGAGPLIVAV